MTSHPSHQTLAAYETGAIEPGAGMTVDAHLDGCAACRGQLRVPAQTAEDSWQSIRTVIRLPVPGRVERLLTRAGLDPGSARMLADTPLLHGGWLVGIVVILAFAGWAAASSADGRHMLPFLLAAPLVPLLGVAASLGRGNDAVVQVAAVTPTDGLHLVLMRTLATSVVGFCIAAVIDAVAIPPDRSWLWVLPSVGVTALALSLGTTLTRPHAVAVAGGLWALVVVVVGLAEQPLVAIRQMTSGWAIAGAAGLIVLRLRRDHYRQPDA